MIFGWGTGNKIYPILNSTSQVVICKYSYFSLIFFPIALGRSWYKADAAALSSEKITKDEAERLVGRKIKVGPGIWGQFGLLILIGLIVLWGFMVNSLAKMGVIKPQEKSQTSSQSIYSYTKNSISAHNSEVNERMKTMTDIFPNYMAKYEENKTTISDNTEYKNITAKEYLFLAISVNEKGKINTEKQTKTIKYADNKFLVVTFSNIDGKEIVQNFEFRNIAP